MKELREKVGNSFDCIAVWVLMIQIIRIYCYTTKFQKNLVMALWLVTKKLVMVSSDLQQEWIREFGIIRRGRDFFEKAEQKPEFSFMNKSVLLW